MVNERIETVTDSLESGTDAVSEGQKNLDGAQTGEQAITSSAPVTQEELRLLKEENRKLQAEVRGLVQGPIDRLQKSLAERERADRDAWAKQEIAGLPEDSQPVAAYVDKRISEMEARLSANQPARVSGPTPEEEAFVRQFGIDPRDPALDYSVLGDESNPNRTVAFMDQVYAVRAKSASPAAPALAAIPVPAPVTPTPVIGTPPPAGLSLQTQDEIDDAYMTGKILRTEYEEKSRAIGVTP